MLRIGVLGSGSNGNSLVLVDGDGKALLVDAGFSRREILARLSRIGVAPERLTGMLLTHEHADHSCGCRVLCDTLNLPLYTTYGTASYLMHHHALPGRVLTFEPGSTFMLENFEITPFPVRHDAEDPVGFIIGSEELRIGIATDLGEVNATARRSLRGCDALVLESNYDFQMLRDSNRQLYLKRRINSRIGHLDNTMTASSLAELVTERTELLLLAHISRECNTYDLALHTAEETLERLGRSDIRVCALRQEEPSELFTIEERCRV